MTTREKIELDMPTVKILTILGEGNPGAWQVLTTVISRAPGLTGARTILDLDDMNIRGSAIWYAFKDFAGEDYTVFVKAVQERSQEMVDSINEMLKKYEPERDPVVTHGGS